ncbi:hypothetical protein ABZS29_07355 [Kribbella sp. NPDC005582]|uniref:hypothetical protein n=1 Tax=Kribbella sp. NPDC005582 TaxID=3156893 RepID=UPI0033AA92E8
MSAQNDNFQNDECSSQADTETDPLGPVTLPTRIRIGARAMALTGVVGLSAFAAAVTAVCDPQTTTSVSHH